MIEYFTIKNILLGIPITYFSAIAISMINDYYYLKKKKKKIN